MSEFTREQIIEAAKHCIKVGEDENCVCQRCPFDFGVRDFSDCILDFAYYIAESQKNEPAQSANRTSSTNNNLYLNDSMILKICQEGILNLLDTLLECNVVEKEYIEGYLRALTDILHLIKEETRCQ